MNPEMVRSESDDAHRALQESLDLRDQGHAED